MAGSKPRSRADVLMQLARSSDKAQQAELRSYIREEPDYYELIFHVFFRNPFFHLLEDEAAFMASNKVTPGLRELLTARAAAAQSTSRKYAVFCMPKSGSSFVLSALQHALQLPYVSLTSVAPPATSSQLGMNSREQELDDLAIVTAVLSAQRGFVAQSHTRYSRYLGRQLAHYGIKPILTVRNILDCIVSFDDMMVRWRLKAPAASWMSDAQFALPADYQDLPRSHRYEILGPTFGTWLVNFYLSWRRGIAHGQVAPVLIQYEDDILNLDRLIDRVSDALNLAPAERERFAGFAREPDKEKARFNVGRSGRGLEQIPQSVVTFLTRYASSFRKDLSDLELRMLLA